MEPNSKFSLSLRYYDKIVATALIFIGIGTVFYHLVEKFTWVDSLYFTVITLATIGYGDLAPQTTVGKLFTVGYVLVGITIFVALAYAILAKIISRRVVSPSTLKTSSKKVKNKS